MLRIIREQDLCLVVIGLIKANGEVTTKELMKIFKCSSSNIGQAIKPLIAARILEHTRGSNAKITLVNKEVTFLDVVTAIQGQINLGYGLRTDFYKEFYETASMVLADFMNKPIPAIETLEEME